MSKHDLLHKIELAGLVALAGLCAPGLNSLLPVKGVALTESIKAKQDESQKSYFKGTKIASKEQIKTFQDNGQLKKIINNTYNRESVLTNTKMLVYTDQGIPLFQENKRMNSKLPNEFLTITKTNFFNGKLTHDSKTSIKVYDKANNIQLSQTYKHDRHKKKILYKEEKYTYTKGVLVSKELSMYHNNGILLSRQIFLFNKDKVIKQTIYKYNEQGQMYSKMIYNEKNELVK